MLKPALLRLKLFDLERWQQMVDSIYIPSGVGRVVRKVKSNMSKLTAEQWRNFLALMLPIVTHDLCKSPEASKYYQV